ncbi:YciI family protein [Actinoplanes sp. CA-142083]|uniref:YciI family protein n=1 Tax=Actinoplanes sp. CA-142083 TaxID=3239903 RepID=UPI003D943B7E
MQYLLLIYGDEKVWASRDEQEQQANHERHARFMAMLRERGALVGGEELALASTATTIRNGDRVRVTDGPYAETAEQIGGYYVIEAADLDEALELARQLPEPIVEVRPIVMHPPTDS